MSRRNSLLVAASILLSASAFGQWTTQQGGRPGTFGPTMGAVTGGTPQGPRESRWASESFNLFSRSSDPGAVDDSEIVRARARAREDSLARARDRWIEQARARDRPGNEALTSAAAPAPPMPEFVAPTAAAHR